MSKNDNVTNNMTESFNSWLGELRGKPIMQLVLHLETKMMNRLYKRREKSQKWESVVTPKVRERLTRNCNEGCLMTVAPAGFY